MDEEIKKFKSTNGNSNYTPKEIMQGVHTIVVDGFKENREDHKVMNKRLSDGDKDLAKLNTWRNAHSIVLASVIATLGWIIKLLITAKP